MAASQTEPYQRYIGPAATARAGPTSVRNWNQAALLASGDLLFVIADDLEPPLGWDLLIYSAIRGLNPALDSFALKIGDRGRTDVIVRHPVISKKFFKRFGLFDDKFHHLYCDDDFSLRAFWCAQIIDTRDIEFRHIHQSSDPSVTPTRSQIRGNSSEERVRGRAALQAKWSSWKRIVGVQVIPVDEFKRTEIWRRLTVALFVFSRIPHLVLRKCSGLQAFVKKPYRLLRAVARSFRRRNQ